MAKFRPYPRQAYNRLFRSWARRNAMLLLAFAVGLVAIVAVETAILMLLPYTAFRWWLLGVVQTVVVGVGLHLVNAAFITHEREAIHQLRGAWGEDATREELKRARRKRLIWGWVDSIGLQAGDLDHVVATRAGGLLAVDSKWRSDSPDTDEMARSAARARTRAEGIARTLLKSERGAHRARGHAITVRPLVVLWGPAQHQVPEGYERAGIPFVGGRRLLDWLESLDGEPVTRGAANETLHALKEFRSRTHGAAPQLKR